MSQTNLVPASVTIDTILHDIQDMFPAGSFSDIYDGDDQPSVATPYGYGIHHHRFGVNVVTNGECTLVMQSRENERASIYLHTYFMENIIVESDEKPGLASVLVPGKGSMDNWYTFKWHSISLLINYNEYIDHKEEYLTLFKLGLDLHSSYVE